ncbi:MAG TPA: DUF58 domain-containing protein [Pirellulales bacterium]|nr:DUF58 domain-containing protein [Pirellulales bacterium]
MRTVTVILADVVAPWGDPLLSAVAGAALLALARWLYLRYGEQPKLFWPLAVVPLTTGLLLGGSVVVVLMVGASGVLGYFVRVSLVLVALGVLAYWFRIFPHRPLLYLAMLPAGLSLVLLLPRISRDTTAWYPLLLLDALVGLAAAADLLSLPRRKSFSIDRETGRVASLGQAHPVTLIVSNYSALERFVWVRDGVPDELNPKPAEFRLALAARSRGVLNYQCHSKRRGSFVLPSAHLRVRSRFGLWQRFLDYDVTSTIHVYPDMKQVSEYALLARTNRLTLLGVRRTRKIGQDNEFERLRDYTPDDNYKHIDWRTTARRQKLTVKDFQANQSQRLIFLLDCGRMMTNVSGGLSLLDHALNSMLMLSYVALAHGDSVGLLSFSDEIHTYVPPAGGMHQMNRLLHAGFDRFPRLVESRYDQAFLYLASHCRKRSLLVLISNLIDEVNANQVGRYLKSFSGKHLPLGVLLRDHRLFDPADNPSPEGDSLYQAAVAADILSWRSQVLADLDAKGVLALDVYPENLTTPLINSYLEIKARHLL